MTPISTIVGALRDFALPARCPGCGVVVEGDGRFCLECWRALEFLTGGGCARCDRPLDGAPEGTVCANCIETPPAHDGVRAAVAYGDVARTIALKLKHGGRPATADIVAAQLARHVEPGALLVPVPLHRWRIWSRGHNQSALIVRALARRTRADASLDALARVKPTPLLRGLGARARARAVRGVFRVPADRRALLQGRAVMLVDDVFTSGATANACARVLKRAGVARVMVLCWARVLHEES